MVLSLPINKSWNGDDLVGFEASCNVSWTKDRDLCIEIESDFVGLDKIPEFQKKKTMSKDELWNCEVVEVFIAAIPISIEEKVPYIEMEFNPQGYYLGLKFLGERHMIKDGLDFKSFEATIEEKRWKGNAIIDGSLIPDGALKINAFACHNNQDTRVYAVHTPMKSEEPNFHLPRLFKEDFPSRP